jgi:hypothetical protein
VEGQIVRLKGWGYFQEHHRHHQQQQQQLLLIKPYDLIQFRIVSEIIYQFGHFVWTGDQPDARPLHLQDSTTQKGEDKHPCFERDSNPRSQYQSRHDPRPRLCGHCDWHFYEHLVEMCTESEILLICTQKINCPIM